MPNKNIKLNVTNLVVSIDNNITLFALDKFDGKNAVVLVFETYDDSLKAYDFIKHTLKNTDVICLNSWNAEPYSFIYPDTFSVGKRLKAIDQIQDNNKKIIVADVKGLMQKFDKNIFNLVLKKGESFDFSKLSDLLTSNGYNRVEEVVAFGDFCIRGDIVDIFPSTEEKPCRIDFFGDEIERIRIFDQMTQLTTADVDRIEIYAANEIQLGEKE
ncbi:MAG: hypothetical protein LBR35_00710, partial [Rickettsiales bacterium]|nr:hypothetical protein [Rickettsiales bacterium]